jgi:hypothetical protein
MKRQQSTRSAIFHCPSVAFTHGLPFPWQQGIESMINGFHARFTPAVVKNRDARPCLDPSFVQRAVDKLA